MNPQQILSYFEDRRDETVAAVRRLVDIESPSRDESQSELVTETVADLLRSSCDAISIEFFDAPGVGRHLIGRLGEGGGGTLLLGHTDTVHPVGTHELNPTRVEGDRLYGCGTFDMKANIAVIAEAVRFIANKSDGAMPPITILLSCDEEVGSHTGRPHVEREAAAASRCLVLEPSAGGRAKTGRKGTGTFTVTAHGLPAHAGLEPDKGANAITELCRQIPNLHTLSDPAAGTTVNVCTIKGGTVSNVIPDLAWCEADVRFSSMAEAERIDAAIRSMVPVDPRVRIEIGNGINRPPMERTPAVIALFEKARSAAAMFGYELNETQVGGASDGNFVGAMGVPVLDGLGLSGDGAHTLNEYVLISDMASRAALLTLLLSQPSGDKIA